jgi:BlaI family penicillinase repressor
MAPKPVRPTDSELEILTVLWSRGPSTVRDVYETLRRRRKSAQYATVLKFMQIMAQKGLLKRDESDRAHVYIPIHSRELIQRQLAGDLLQRGFDWSMKNLMIGALSARKTTKEELAELRKLLEEYEKGKP